MMEDEDRTPASYRDTLNEVDRALVEARALGLLDNPNLFWYLRGLHGRIESLETTVTNMGKELNRLRFEPKANKL